MLKYILNFIKLNINMSIFSKVKQAVIGKPLNMINPKIRDNIALVAVIAWVGLGADGLSSSAYGPEVAYLALGQHTHIAIYLAFATAFTVFLISFAYNQVIELFPNGGGGYQVATKLLGPKAGVVSGAALMIDYVLTIAVSIASGVDALFSMLPTAFLAYKIELSVAAILLLVVLNLRGMKESIKILLPLFMGFLLTHVAIILIGMFYHSSAIAHVIPDAIAETHKMSASVGFFAMMAIFLRAYSLGGGTYTGLEAVSNNVNMLAEPRVRTGKFTMLYMAVSLSFTAGGIILLYLIWHAAPVYGQTLNAVVFNNIIKEAGLSPYFLTALLFFEAALLFVAANTGFLGCPAVMANMAVDKWLPRQFRELSNRLVTQNGVLLSGAAAILVLLWANGSVETLVVLYSINVFLTFSLSLLGLCVYWIKSRATRPEWKRKLAMAAIGFIVCASILIITTLEKFTEGGWLTVLITLCVIIFCLFVRHHYRSVGVKLSEADKEFANQISYTHLKHSDIISIQDKTEKTAVFFVTKHLGAGLHTLLWVQRLFPGVFKNFVFLTVGEVDSETFAKEEIFKKHYRKDLHEIVEKYRLFCSEHGLPSDGLFSYGVDDNEELIKLAIQVQVDYPDCIFFASKLVFVDENWWSRLLHNNTSTFIQRQLHLRGMQMVILPMKI